MPPTNTPTGICSQGLPYRDDYPCGVIPVAFWFKIMFLPNWVRR